MSNKEKVIYTNLPKDVACNICGGSGELIIRNAYDESFEGREQCWSCSGKGVSMFSVSKPKVVVTKDYIKYVE
jgi:DnaJ-class molecular chaperone